MNFNDLLIIYLACGAPFGVYYFLQNRRDANSKSLWLKTVVNFLFWLPLAFRLLWKNKSLQKVFRIIFDGNKTLDAEIEKRVAPIRKNLETTIIKSIPKSAENIPQTSIFEIREVFDRYIGLTLACQIDRKNSQFDNEFYKIFAPTNSQLASICFARRNRQRLFFHQTEARRDFLNLISGADGANFQRQTIEFVRLLEDLTAQDALEKMFAQKAQTEKQPSVNNTEKDLWKSETRKPLPINQTASVRLKFSPATMNLRAKD